MELIYSNALTCEADIKGFISEGNVKISFPEGKLRLENELDAKEGQKANYVLWCPEVFPSDIIIKWKFKPIKEPGLAIMFFSAEGRNGEDIFDSKLQKRTGEYPMYHHGDINAYHISYFRRKEPDERAFHTCNLRTSYGFHLGAQGGDPIPDVDDICDAYEMTVNKRGRLVEFLINELKVFSFTDDGETYGKLLLGGRIGFRQLAPMIGEYSELRVYK